MNEPLTSEPDTRCGVTPFGFGDESLAHHAEGFFRCFSLVGSRNDVNLVVR